MDRVRPYSLILACLLGMGLARAQPTVVPQIAAVETKPRAGAVFVIPKAITVAEPSSEQWRRHLEIVATLVDRATSGKCTLRLTDASDAVLRITHDSNLPVEGYRLNVQREGIEMIASSLKGLAHATATLLQLISTASDGTLPCVAINDAPQASYRSFMVDMGRNPHSIELLKETIDLLWYYKVDSLQLHLTDDQRFAFPSTAFPKVWDGEITLEELHDLEEYALLRGVSLIPELEVPGHSNQLRMHYPDVFGKTATDLATSEDALNGIKVLLDEMMIVFMASPYVHIGGDEAFGVPEEAQRDLINKLHAYLESKGRQTLVWEGPRAGSGSNKVHKDVIHLNWRTINYPADQMLKDGHRVVNAAWDPLYIVDHYPRTNFTMTSPQHIYETMSLTRFKHVNPGIRTFADPIHVQPSGRLIGYCMPWWEGRESNYFAQVVPRILPFAEIAWTSAGNRNYADFAARISRVEAARTKAFYPVTILSDNLAVEEDGVFHASNINGGLQVQLTTEADSLIRYTLDDTLPTVKSAVYSEPIALNDSAVVRAALFDGDLRVGHASRRTFTAVTPLQNLALSKPVRTSATSGAPFSVERITDGGTGNLDFYLGYPALPDPIVIEIDLEEVKQVSRIVVHAYSVAGSFEKYTVEVSADGEHYTKVASRLQKPEKVENAVQHTFDPTPVRFIRVVSYGNKGYVFDSFSKLIEVLAFE